MFLRGGRLSPPSVVLCSNLFLFSFPPGFLFLQFPKESFQFLRAADAIPKALRSQSEPILSFLPFVPRHFRIFPKRLTVRMPSPLYFVPEGPLKRGEQTLRGSNCGHVGVREHSFDFVVFLLSACLPMREYYPFPT